MINENSASTKYILRLAKWKRENGSRPSDAMYIEFIEMAYKAFFESSFILERLNEEKHGIDCENGNSELNEWVANMKNRRIRGFKVLSWNTEWSFVDNELTIIQNEISKVRNEKEKRKG
jgi:hypothetical protein